MEMQTNEDPLLTWEEKDRLLIEVVMGVAEGDSKVRYTAKSARLRRRFVAQRDNSTSSASASIHLRSAWVTASIR